MRAQAGMLTPCWGHANQWQERGWSQPLEWPLAPSRSAKWFARRSECVCAARDLLTSPSSLAMWWRRWELWNGAAAALTDDSTMEGDGNRQVTGQLTGIGLGANEASGKRHLLEEGSQWRVGLRRGWGSVSASSLTLPACC